MSEDNSSIVTKQKHTMGRKKINIKKIENNGSLQVTFSKRRGGLFRKVSQLSTLCGAEVAVLVFSPRGRPFVFGHPSVDYVLSRFASTGTSLHGRQHNSMHTSVEEDDYDKGNNPIQSKAMHQTSSIPESFRFGLELVREGHGFWWDQSIEKMKLHELKDFRSSLEDLKAKVHTHLDEMAIRKLVVRDYLGANPKGR